MSTPFGLSLHFEDIEVVRRVRRTDPGTSVAAAERTKRFANSHSVRILEAIRVLQARGEWATQATIAEASGLSVAAVSKRLVEIERAGQIKVLREYGRDVEHNGCRCWGIV